MSGNSSRSVLPSAVRRRGRALLHQQCWLWGRDIKRAEGNLLLHYGFDRIREPGGTSGFSQYTLSLPGNLYVRLWGFGIYFGYAEGVFLNRFDFVPRATSLQDGWQSLEMTGLPRAQDLSLFPSVLRWMSSYEKRVLEEWGPEYRATSLAGWKTRIAVKDISVGWLGLAQQVEKLLYRLQPLNPLMRITSLPVSAETRLSSAHTP
ncbi:hypothetical protein [Acidicapsa ligni]|uniref:hypothetical protein n=1 Tax=Acidicapsa ligni TaxID=542300 RepID=UPI0021E0DE42|nr:hypothetical protein [Acidicapsa ligni]